MGYASSKTEGCVKKIFREPMLHESSISINLNNEDAMCILKCYYLKRLKVILNIEKH